MKNTMTQRQISNEEDILAKLAGILSKDFGIEKERVCPEGRLNDDFDLDSLDRVELLMMCEEEFEIEIPDEEAEKFITISDVLTYIDKKRNR